MYREEKLHGFDERRVAVDRRSLILVDENDCSGELELPSLIGGRNGG